MSTHYFPGKERPGGRAWMSKPYRPKTCAGDIVRLLSRRAFLEHIEMFDNETLHARYAADQAVSLSTCAVAVIDTAPISAGVEFGPCLLWAALPGCEGAPRWFVGEWGGENWCDDEGLILSPTDWSPLPPVPALAQAGALWP